MERTEHIILRGLIYDEPYTRRVLPFIKDAYFNERNERLIFVTIKKFLEDYHTIPTKETILVDVANSLIPQDQYNEIQSILTDLEAEKEEKPPVDWLVSISEQWCQERAIHNAAREVLNIIGDKSGKKQRGIMPKLMEDALAVGFDSHVGHDYLEDADDRFDFYTKPEQKLPFHLDYFNKITKNGIRPKTLNVILAGTGAGKTLFMCDLAADYFLKNRNVLYISMEVSEEEISRRIDANLMEVSMDEFEFGMPKTNFTMRLDRIKKKSSGKLIVKEYPTTGASIINFRQLMNELQLKKKFVPHVVFVDYVSICASSRTKMGTGGMYEWVKAIAEELRGFAVEFNVPVWTAIQMNRAGFNNNDPDLTNTAESFGVPATADLMFALVTDATLRKQNQLLVKLLKNRYGDVNVMNDAGNVINRFLIGVDYKKMKLYDLIESAQSGLCNNDIDIVVQPPTEAVLPPLIDDDPVFDIDVL